MAKPLQPNDDPADALSQATELAIRRFLHENGEKFQDKLWRTGRIVMGCITALLLLAGGIATFFSWKGMHQFQTSLDLMESRYEKQLAGRVEDFLVRGDTSKKVQEYVEREYKQLEPKLREDLKKAIEAEVNSEASTKLKNAIEKKAQEINSQSLVNLRIPTGALWAFPGKTAPPGWLLCNGDPLPENDPTYDSLRTFLTENFGSCTHLPDYRGRVLAMTDNPSNFGTTRGAESIRLTPANLPSHTHSGTTDNGEIQGEWAIVYQAGQEIGGHHHVGHKHSGDHRRIRKGQPGSNDLPGLFHVHPFTTDGGKDLRANPESFSIYQPTVFVNYIIKI